MDSKRRVMAVHHCINLVKETDHKKLKWSKSEVDRPNNKETITKYE